MTTAPDALNALEGVFKGRVNIIHRKTKTHDEIIANYQPTALTFSTNARSVIEDVWREKLRTGVKLYNGQLFHLKSMNKSDRKLVLSLGNTDYKEFVGTSSTQFRQVFPKRKTLPCPVGVAAVVRGLEGNILLGFRAEGFAGAYPDKFDLPAGWLERDLDLNSEKVALVDAMHRELREEEDVMKNDILKTEYLGMIIDPAVNAAGIIYQVFLNLTLSDLGRRVPTDLEFSKHVQLEASPDSVVKFLSDNQNRITPGGACALFLCLEAAR